jgi:hypothetical protein
MADTVSRTDTDIKHCRLVITVTDPLTFSLAVEVKGEVPGIDYVLNMLAQATRVFEAERRKQEAADYAREQMEAELSRNLIMRPQ